MGESAMKWSLVTDLRARGLIALILLFMVTRIGIAYCAEFWIPERKWTHFVVSDGADYYWTAVNLLNGKGYSSSPAGPYTPSATRTPLHPLYLAAVMAVFGESVSALILAQILLQLVTVVLMYLAFLHFYSFLPALIVALYTVFDPVYLVASVSLYSETLYFLLNLLFVILWITCLRSRFSVAKTLLLALTFSAAALTRPIGLYLLPLVAISIALIETSWRLRISRVILFVLVAAAVVSPWLLRNQAVFGAWSFSSLGGPHIYYYWALPFHLERSAGNPDVSLPLSIKDEPPFRNPFDRSSYLSRRALEIILEAPRAYASFHVRSSWRLFVGANSQALSVLLGWKVVEPAVTESVSVSKPGVNRDWRQVAVIAWNLLLMSGLGILTLVGLGGLVQHQQIVSVAVTLSAVAYYLLIIGPEPSTRYRLSFLPYLLYYAGAGVVVVGDLWQKSKIPSPRLPGAL